jgi:hypothetical protein
MKLTKPALCFATLMLGIASAASPYTVTLESDTAAGATQLKAGTYKLELNGNQAIFKRGKESIPVAVSVEKAPNTFRYTAVDTKASKLIEIDLRGTNTKLLFASAPGSVATE